MNDCVCASAVADKQPDFGAVVAAAEQEKKRGRKAQSVDMSKPLFHQIVRYISKTGQQNQGAEPLDWVNDYIGSYLAEGYRLVDTHYLGETPEGYGMMYVLVVDGFAK